MATIIYKYVPEQGKVVKTIGPEKNKSSTYSYDAATGKNKKTDD